MPERPKRERNREADRYYDQYLRNPKAAAFYRSPAWLKVRQMILARDHGLCQECLRHGRITPARAVHHKKPLLQYWELRLDPDNLESICDECHNRERIKNAAEGLTFDENGDLVRVD